MTNKNRHLHDDSPLKFSLVFFSFDLSSLANTGIDFKQKLINLDGVPIKLQIWDTAGQERFRTLTTAYYRGAMGILLMYDVTNLESFNNLSYWLRNIQEVSESILLTLVLNKF
jgi:Rab family, other